MGKWGNGRRLFGKREGLREGIIELMREKGNWGLNRVGEGENVGCGR